MAGDWRSLRPRKTQRGHDIGTWLDLLIAVEVHCPNDGLHGGGHDAGHDVKLRGVFDDEFVNAEDKSLLGEIGIAGPLLDHIGDFA